MLAVRDNVRGGGGKKKDAGRGNTHFLKGSAEKIFGLRDRERESFKVEWWVGEGRWVEV